MGDTAHDDHDLERQFPGGRVEETAVGSCFVVDRVYPLTYRHGSAELARLLELDPGQAAGYCGDQRLSSLDFRDFVFLDTETTGLYGAGTIAFLVGAAFFNVHAGNESLVVRQYFLRDHGDEAAMLHLLDELVAEHSGLVTFNGRVFDLPLLQNRYLLNRMTESLGQSPHIDLLTFARRLWRTRFGSVALGNLEPALLGVRRTEEDVPGWMIPEIYSNYLRSRSMGDLKRVFYHNEIDMLSMVTLADKTMRLIGQQENEIDPVDLYALAKWQADLGLEIEAEAAFKTAVGQNLPLTVYHNALEKLSLLLKRQERYQEAIPLWQQWAATSLETVDAHVELAKYFEWHAQELRTAERWTLEAISLSNSWSRARATLVRPELDHRLARIRRKIKRESE